MEKSVGMNVHFICGSIEGDITIVGMSGEDLIIKYMDYDDYIITTQNFKSGMLSRYLNVKSSEFKIEIGTEFKDYKRDILITDREYRVLKR